MGLVNGHNWTRQCILLALLIILLSLGACSSGGVDRISKVINPPPPPVINPQPPDDGSADGGSRGILSFKTDGSSSIQVNVSDQGRLISAKVIGPNVSVKSFDYQVTDQNRNRASSVTLSQQASGPDYVYYTLNPGSVEGDYNLQLIATVATSAGDVQVPSNEVKIQVQNQFDAKATWVVSQVVQGDRNINLTILSRDPNGALYNRLPTAVTNLIVEDEQHNQAMVTSFSNGVYAVN
ncbi:MAG: hypothetical protein HY537_11885, partial [Deltaproteobacteria bacterium]|nr:hypothetical protein [Deltaproteobacteria bacterium]